jgi:colanic acid/amylovoran biosynthesis glycosyltransferase
VHGPNPNVRRKSTRNGLLNLCIVQPNRVTYSETFIQNHIQKLPARTTVLYGGWFPTRIEGGGRLVPLPLDVLERFRSKLPAVLNVPGDYIRTLLLRRYLNGHRIDVVLAEYGPTGASIVLACKQSRIPLVVHFHGFDAYEHAILEEFQDHYRRLFKSAWAIIAPSRDMHRQLLLLGAPPEHTHHIPYGVDPAVFSGGDPGKARPVFVAVGRFVDKKAPHLTLLAFHKVLTQVADARLIMIGDGTLLETSRQMAKSLGMEQSVEFLGPRAPNEVAAVLRAARAFVQHSLTTTYGDSEGTPLAILEAGATGLPVVSTRHAGIKDVVREGNTGYLVDEGDVDAMAMHMTRLAQDAELSSAMGRAARKHISSNFSLEQRINELWAILAAAVERRNG